MLRGLAFFLLALYVLPVQAYAQTDKTQQGYKGNQPPPPVAPVAIKQDDGPKLQPEHHEHVDSDVRVISTPAKDRYDKAAFWINFTLALVGIGGIAVGVSTVLFIKAQVIEMRRQRILTARTLIAIRRQAALMEIQAGHMEKQTQILAGSVEVAQKSADNTRLQIEIFINAERARITMEISEMGRSFKIYAKNTGRGMASITSCRGSSKVMPFSESLPETPQYFVPVGWDYVEQVNSGVKFDIMNEEEEYRLMADLSDDKLCESIRDKSTTLWVFGRVCYGDGISSTARETRFCYRTFLLDNGDISICAGGPAAYRLET